MDTAKLKKIIIIIKAEMTLKKKKKIHDEERVLVCFINFQSIISLHVQTLALNKSMRAFDDEQGINKLRPKQITTCIYY